MSFGIVRVMKCKAGSVKGIEIHNTRTKKGVSHTNKDIDWEKSHLNYDLNIGQTSNQSFQQIIKARIKELQLKKSIRKDAVVMAQVLVTSDNEFFEKLNKEQQEQFFKDSYDFLSNRYGKENVISATVHLDEKTPHMHFGFVPVTADGRLSAKSILTRKSLSEQHTDFYHQVGKHYGLERGIVDSKNKNIEMQRYKALTATQNALEATKRYESVQNATEVLNAEYEAKKAYVRECGEFSNISYAMPDFAKQSVKTKGILKKQVVEEFVTVPKDKWIAKHVSANEKRIQEKAMKAFDEKIEDFKKTYTAEYIEQLKQKNDDLKQQNKLAEVAFNSVNENLKYYKTQYNSFVKKLEKVLKRCQIEVEYNFRQEWLREEQEQKSNRHEYEMEM